ncbi:hypothetical protein WH5701_03219 [Synechococcus sp. WH 5701]|nr:hypothetical protein WH5701_03219 [Synechococcus sp. WH 5701]
MSLFRLILSLPQDAKRNQGFWLLRLKFKALDNADVCFA